MIKTMGLLILMLLAPLSLAAIDTYDFETEEQRARFYQLGSELRCPKCQNQNIADSNAPIATDLRREIYRLLNEGHSNKEIVEFMVMRYGDFVRYSPALTAQTAVLWFAPAVFLLIGFGALAFMLRQRRRALAAPDKALSDQERERLQNLLKKKTQDD
jgi:cytochrome c-type biogenesis protein CcmH